MALTEGTNCGFVTTAPTADPEATGASIESINIASKFTSPLTAIRVTEIGFYSGQADNEGEIVLGIYDHDVGNDLPLNLVGKVTVTKTSGAGWKSGTTNITISSNTVYWVAILAKDTVGSTYLDRSTNASYRCAFKTAQTDLTNPFPASPTTQGLLNAIYAVWSDTNPISGLTTNSFYWGA